MPWNHVILPAPVKRDPVSTERGIAPEDYGGVAPKPKTKIESKIKSGRWPGASISRIDSLECFQVHDDEGLLACGALPETHIQAIG